MYVYMYLINSPNSAFFICIFSAAPEEEGSDILLAATGALWTGHCGSAAQGKSTLEPH